MTTHEINTHIANGGRTFRVRHQSGTAKVEVMETGVPLGPMYGHQKGGVRVKLIGGNNDGDVKVIQSRDVVRGWTQDDERQMRNHIQKGKIEDRIATDLLALDIEGGVRIDQSHDSRKLVLNFSGADAIAVLDKLGVNSDISYEQRI
jgi:hypothetical protein